MADRLVELRCKAQDAREELAGILAKAEAGDLGATERAKMNTLTGQIRDLDIQTRAEEAMIEQARGGGRLAGDHADLANDDEPALMLPALPSRTLRTLRAMAGGASASSTDRQQHFAAVIRAAVGGNPFDPMMATGIEGMGSQGGFAVRDDVSSSIFTRAAEGSVFARIGARMETSTTDLKTVVALDDDDESSDAEAGMTSAWTAETAEATPQLMLLRSVTFPMLKLMVLAAVSGELAEDAMPDLLAQYETAIGRAIGKKFDRAIVSGTGVGQPLGILASPARITVIKTIDGDPGTLNTFTWKHAVGMWSRLAPGSHENAWWLAHPTVLPQLLSMHLKVQNAAASDNVGGFQPMGAFAPGGPTGYLLLGRPVVITGRVKSLSTEGDVILCDPTQLAIVIRRNITIDRSPHAYFTSDRLALRGKFRGNAGPLWETTRTLQEGSTTVSPFVTLATRT